MPVATNEREYFPRRINQYVPAMQYASDVSLNSPHRVNFGTPATTDADAVITAAQDLQANVADSKTTFLGAIGGTMDAEFGRTLTCTAGAAVGSATEVVVTIVGRDYLGQPMTETITVTHADSTNAVAGLKAFKWLDSVSTDGGGSTDTYILVGVNTGLGLPYKATKVLAEELDGAPRGTLGTLTAPVLTDPATATTGDPRGTYAPNATMTGSATVTATFLISADTNSSGNGGLYGIKHYYA